MHVITDPNQLSPEQQELIAAAATNRGTLQICNRSNTYGRAVCTKTETFSDAVDREVAQCYLREIRELERYLLLRQAHARETYELTNFGWQISRKLVAAVPTTNP
jgi:polyphosphate kinase 2 (PPK2 family)